jgi:hypothetical protein
MAAYNKIQSFVEALAEKKHNLGSDALTIGLTTVANTPSASADNVLADISPISYTNLSARVPTITSSVHTTGTYKLILADLVLTASGTVAAFGTVVLYNDTATNDELICWWEYGSDVTLLNTETFTINFDDSGGVLTIA